MLEDLEASVGFQAQKDGTMLSLLRLTKSASVSIESRVLRLQRLVFAHDFLLGQHQGRVLAVNFLAIRNLELFAGGQASSQVSKTKMSAWIKSLPRGLQVSVVLVGAERQAKATIMACDSKFLCLSSNQPGLLATAVPFSAVQWIEFDPVDNNIGVRA